MPVNKLIVPNPNKNKYDTSFLKQKLHNKSSK